MNKIKLTFNGKDMYASPDQVMELLLSCEKALISNLGHGAVQRMKNREPWQIFKRMEDESDTEFQQTDF